MTNGYWYLATPYAKYSTGKTQAYLDALEQTAFLLNNGISVYSPIVHNHPISLHPSMSANLGSFDFWVRFVDQPMMDGAVGLIVCKLEGWFESEGVDYERDYFYSIGKPIVFMEPNYKPIIRMV